MNIGTPRLCHDKYFGILRQGTLLNQMLLIQGTSMNIKLCKTFCKSYLDSSMSHQQVIIAVYPVTNYLSINISIFVSCHEDIPPYSLYMFSFLFLFLFYF